jgi:hypothetical protein
LDPGAGPVQLVIQVPSGKLMHHLKVMAPSATGEPSLTATRLDASISFTMGLGSSHGVCGLKVDVQYSGMFHGSRSAFLVHQIGLVPSMSCLRCQHICKRLPVCLELVKEGAGGA